MAKGAITVGDLSPSLRRKGAEVARSKLREMLSNPFLPAEHRTFLASKLQEVDEWERGASKVKFVEGDFTEAPVRNALSFIPPPVTKREGTNHEVALTEDLKVDET